MIIQYIACDSTDWAYDGDVCPTCYTQGNWVLAQSGRLPKVGKAPCEYLSPIGTIVNSAEPGGNTWDCLAGRSQGYDPRTNEVTPAVLPFDDLLRADADIVVIGDCINDAKHGNIGEYEDNLRYMWDAATCNGSQVWFKTPHPTPYVANGWTGEIHAFIQRMRDVADDLGAPLIDINADCAAFSTSILSPQDGTHQNQKASEMIGYMTLKRARKILGLISSPTTEQVQCLA